MTKGRDMTNAQLKHRDESEIDIDQAKAFNAALADHYNSAAITTMISIGHKTGLFDKLANLPPATSAEIAEVTGLNERYVREWLAAMVTGRVIEYEPRTKTYWLPEEHAASLTRGALLGNMAVYSQFAAMMGGMQEDLIHHFREGGGTHYHDYHGFHDIMAEDSDQTIVAAIDDKVVPLVPGLRQKLEAGIEVLDAGCGKGHAMIAFAERFPNSRFRGYDFSADAIEKGRRIIAEKGLSNVTLEVVDMTDFGELGRYDLITSFDAVHDQKHPQLLIKGIHAGLKPGGTYLMQDIAGSAYLEKNLDMPMAAYLYTVSCLHCMAISLGQGGDGLGTMWGWETAQQMLQEAGFASITKHVLEHDPLNVWFVSTKSA
jgi:2-polyprenyl-3-methyl-5-hydroxy-6-metoxy-1,4-benzoquinol methylase